MQLKAILCRTSTKNSCTMHTHTTHPFNGSFSGTTQVSRYQKGKTNLDFTEARDSEWQRHQLGHMQASTLLQTDNHTSTPPLSFLQAGCPTCRPTVSKHWRKKKITLNLLCEYQCTSSKFIRLRNQIEYKKIDSIVIIESKLFLS